MLFLSTDITQLPKSSTFPLHDLPLFNNALLFLKTHPIVFIVLNGLLVFCLIVSILKWKHGTKTLKKITNRYTADGEKKPDSRAPINLELFAVLFLVVNLCWIVVQVIPL